MSFSIKGTGSAYPERIVSNEELAKDMDTSDEWISTRTGIRNRRVSVDETMTSLSVDAARRALADADTKAEELDMIIFSTIHGEYNTPSMACVVAQELGAECPGFDVNAACSGFVYALDVAAGFFARGKVKKVLVVAAEMMTHLVDWDNRSTSVLFGDAAGAVVLTEGDDLLATRLTAKGNVEVLNCPNYIGNTPYSKQEHKPTVLYMNGREVYRFAVSSMVQDLTDVVALAGLSEDEVDWILPHQANLRIIEGAQGRLPYPKEKYGQNIEDYANTSSACIPCLMDQMSRAGKFKKGDILALSAFGGGLTTGAAVLRWSK